MIHTKTGLKRLKDVNWDEISWKEIDKKISLLQQRIFKASRNGNKSNVKYLQSVLVKLPDAKLLAVRKVTTENIGKKKGLIDKQIITTQTQKLKLTIKLNIDGKASPVRRVWIPKTGKSSMRPLEISTIRDRAKQMLVKMALEPAWEAKFEPNSYGSRPGRNCHDAITAIFNNVRSTTKPKWILDADLKGCYDNIDHDYLLKCLNESPTYIIKQVKSWLQAGIFEGYLPYDKDFEIISINSKYIPQGDVISPLLANIALHELETHLKEWNSRLPEPDGSYKKPQEKYKALGVVRYADDFIITHYDKQRIVEAKQELENWLNKTSKLELSKKKTTIKFIREGFYFLGFRIVSIYRNGKYITKIYPQKSSVKNITQKAHNIIFSNKAVRVEWLIIKLRPVLLGWANYFRFSECSETFNKLDYTIWNMLRKWVNRRSTAGGRIKAWNKYFPGTETTFHGKTYKDKYILKSSSKANERVFIPKMAWIESKRWIKIKSNSSPYDRDKVYWANRKVSYAGLTTLQYKLLVKQKFLCPICGGKINPWNLIEVGHIKSKSKGGYDSIKNEQVLHNMCHIETNKK